MQAWRKVISPAGREYAQRNSDGPTKGVFIFDAAYGLLTFMLFNLAPVALACPLSLGLRAGAFFVAGAGMEFLGVLWSTVMQRHIQGEILSRVTAYDIMGSVSRELTALVVARLDGGQEHEVVYRDTVAEDLPHFTPVTAPSAHPISKAVPMLDEAQQSKRDNSEAILREFMEADVVVIGVPMYNFTLPSELKAWIDRIIIPGTTFRPGPNGIEGLAGGKRVILAIARGGYYGEESVFNAAEHAESLLRTALGFIGVQNVETVVAEGLNTPDSREKAIAAARHAAQQIV